MIKGAKVLVMLGEETLVYCRDTHAGVVWPGVWDIPGGGLEPGETAVQAAVRELEEETGLEIEPRRLQSLTRFAGRGGEVAIFRLELEPGEEALCRFGSEGHSWGFEPLARFLERTDAVEPLQQALIQTLSDG